MVSLILSHPRTPCSGRRVHGSCLDNGWDIPLAQHLLDAGQRAGCFSYIYSVLTKTLRGGLHYPQVMGEKTESINWIYLLSAMPVYEPRCVLLHICCLFLFISHHEKCLWFIRQKAQIGAFWKIKRTPGNPPFKARQSSDLTSVNRAAGDPGWHQGQGWGGGFSGRSSGQLSLTASPQTGCTENKDVEADLSTT